MSTALMATALMATARPEMPLVRLGGVAFRPTTQRALDDAIHEVLACPDRPPIMVGYVNPHVVTSAVAHPEITRHLASCDHVCVDGVGVSLALRHGGFRSQRLPAHEAVDRLVASQVLRGRTVLIGIEADEIGRAAEAIEALGRLEVVAAIDGFASDERVIEECRRLGDDAVDVVLIGAGSPRSEQLAELVASVITPRVLVHAGAGTLKVHAGTRRHPPSMLARLGLGWLYRLIVEPHTRDRYLRGIPAFVRLVRSDPVDVGPRTHRRQG